MQQALNADFWTSLGPLAFVVGAPIAAITTIVVMWTDVTNRARSLRAGGAPGDTIRSVCAGDSGGQMRDDAPLAPVVQDWDMFTFDPNSSYMMPAHFGPRQFDPRASGWYHDVTAITTSYVTDRDQLSQYVPAPFVVTDEAVVTVVYANNRRVDWLAGHGYNLIGVSASVRFNGDADVIDGQFTLVMWENLTDPILTGRELQGVPKLYADIEDHSVIGDVWQTSASHFGHKIVDLSARNLREPTADEIAAAADGGENTSMGWRYLPGVSGFGETTSQPTAFPSQNVITEAWVGEGAVEWQALSWEQNPTQFHIVNALAGLPVLEPRPAIVSKGSTNLILLDDLPRAIS